MKTAKIKFILAFSLVLLSAIWPGQAVLANIFNTSPARIEIKNIKPGQTFKTNLIISRLGTAETNTVSLNSQDNSKSWLNPKQITFYTFPEGEKKLTIPLEITIPKDTKTGNYQEKLTVTIESPAIEKNQALNIKPKIAHQVLLYLQVTTTDVKDFNINWTEIIQAQATFQYKKITVPAKLKLIMELDNLGNVAIAPRKLDLKIYDQNHKKLTTETTVQDIAKTVPAFRTGKVILPLNVNNLKAGTYIAEMDIYGYDQFKPIYSQQDFFQVRYHIGSAQEAFEYLRAKYLLKLIILLLTVSLIIVSTCLFLHRRRSHKRKKHLRHRSQTHKH